MPPGVVLQAFLYNHFSSLWGVFDTQGRFWAESCFKFHKITLKWEHLIFFKLFFFSFSCIYHFSEIRIKCWNDEDKAQLDFPIVKSSVFVMLQITQITIVFVCSYFGVRNTIAGSWSFPGAAGQLPGPSSGRPASQLEPFSWLTSQHLQPASYTLHLQHRSSPPTRWWNDMRHFPVVSSPYQYHCSHHHLCLLVLSLAPISSTDTPHTPSLYSRLEASTEQPEGDEVFFDMLVKCQVRKINLLYCIVSRNKNSIK